MRILSIIYSGIIVLLFSQSCSGLFSKKNKGWEKDYGSYQMGAYINGKEFHNEKPGLIHGPDPRCGFQLTNQDSLVVIQMVSTVCLTDTKTRYWLELYVFADSSKVKSGVEFCFDGTRWDYNWRHEFALGNYKVFNHLPLVYAALTKTPTAENNPFYLTNGRIRFSDFFYDEGKWLNAGTVFFEGKAEDDNGNVLTIEEGYCKRYSHF